MNKFYIDSVIKRALNEDIGYGDVTALSIDESSEIVGRLILKENGIIAGLNIFKRVFELIDENIEIVNFKEDGQKSFKDEILSEIKGNSRNILTGERVALNFLQHLSGIATETRKYVDIAKKYNVQIVDTRKTLPNLRYMQKYAVKIGGGKNHRIGLYDMAMIKDNHIKAAGSITKAVDLVRKNASFPVKIEVETFNIADVEEAKNNRVDIIMLDNFSKTEIKEAMELINKECLVEISGNVSFENLENYCTFKPDIISVGKLTYSVKALDISMKFF